MGMVLDDPTPCVVQADTGQMLYGVPTYITDRGLVVVLASYRRKWVQVKKRVKGRMKVVKEYLSPWMEVDPPRKFFSTGGKVVGAAPPEIEEKE